MPTATPFTALGAGNGFPFCIEEDPNMSAGYTLGQVMNVFWNIKTINVANLSFSHTQSDPYEPPSFQISVEKLDCREPRERVCSVSRYEENIVDDFTYDGDPDKDYFDYVYGTMSVRLKFKPHKGEVGSNFEGQYNLSGKLLPIIPVIELEFHVNSSGVFLEHKIMEYYPFLLDNSNMTFAHTITAGEIQLYGYYQNFFYSQSFDASSDPHITSIDFYTYQ